ncbi:hypothetical protein, partial [Variovorax sp. dw_308]|uniref:hypothetical protein n=1 Tax=Variovorax sp. dw_308 TaxID=2721546 RepID=UPI001C48CAF7
APAPAPAPGAPGAAGAKGGGLEEEAKAEADFLKKRTTPAVLFGKQITGTGDQVQKDIGTRATGITHAFAGGFAGTVDETGVVAAVRGVSAARGLALEFDAYPTFGRVLEPDLVKNLGENSTEYAATRAWLRGDAVEAARLELKDSPGFFNDDEARVEAVMRALTPAQAAALGAQHGDVVAEVSAALDGTDSKVFDALKTGDQVTADALRLKDEVDAARRENDKAALNRAIEARTTMGADSDARALLDDDPDARRKAVVAALGGLVAETDWAKADTTGKIANMSAEARAVDYVTRDIQVHIDDGAGVTYSDGPAQTGGQNYTLTLKDADKDLSVALLTEKGGADSVAARAARVGIALQSDKDFDPESFDKATFDAGFSADWSKASLEERAAHRQAAEKRAAVVLLAAQKYAPEPPGTPAPAADAKPGAPVDPAAAAAKANDPTTPITDPKVIAARDRVIDRLNEKLGAGSLDAKLAVGLITDARPTPETCAIAMDHVMHAHWGTNEELLFRFTERMDRDEIAKMRAAYKVQTGKSLDAELGVYGEGGDFNELSGDDRLRMERAMKGVARNDREKLENAAFAIAQQRSESGGLGSMLADGTYADQAMTATSKRLEVLAGGPIALNRRGELISSLPNFKGDDYQGADRATFEATTAIAQAVAENYSSRIDAFADIATTGIAILGAIAAAVITVATGGAAAPLIAAAVVTGLASMSANYAIKGGRYGWEQAGIDLAMTAVQAITAGVGAQLGKAAQVASKAAQAAQTASRSLVTLAKIFTGNPVVDQIIIGAITGGIGGLGNAALDEKTWKGSSGDSVMALFGGLIKGGLAGAATASVTQSIEALGRNAPALRAQAEKLAAGGTLSRVAGVGLKGVSKVGGAIGAGMNASSEGGLVKGGLGMAGRGLTKASISAAGGMAGKATELAVDSGTGKFKGDMGAALVEIGHAGLHSFVQGFGEGAAESVGQGIQNRSQKASGARINSERERMGLKPLQGDALHAAVEDLQFLDTHGRNGNDALGRAINLDHIATHGGLIEAPVAAPAAGRATPYATEAEGATPRTAPADSDATPPPRATGGSEEPSTVRPAPTEEPSPRPVAIAEEAQPPKPAATAEADQRLLPHLSDAEIGHAIDHAEAGPAMRIGAEQPGADTRALPPASPEATLLQRQAAGALHEQADALMKQANGLLDKAIAKDAEAAVADTHNPRRAAALREESGRLLNEAIALEAQAVQHRAEAAEFASGRKSATADLPGPEDVDAMFANLTSEKPGRVQVPLSDVERNPDLLPRLVRPLLEGEGGGRLVFRVESERSRSLVHVDAQGNVHVEGGASAHLNFGSFERAVEFVMNNSQGKARIIAFEVDEGWVRAMRSAAIPEHGTADLHGQPRLVDVRFADDQMEVPAGLIGELNRMIKPGSGRVHEIDAPSGPAGGPNPLLPHDGTASPVAGSRMQLATEPVITHPLNALNAAIGEAFGLSSVGPLTTHGAREGALHLSMTDAEGRPMKVKVEVGDTEHGAIASFRRNPDGDDPMYFVRLSPNAPLETHGRAIAHELTEVRHHHTEAGTAADALRPGAAVSDRLSAHDRGRLGELEVLAKRLASVPEADNAARAQVHADIEALAAHLGLLHADVADPRLKLALDALPEHSPARAALADAQQRSRSTDTTDDLLQPGRAPAEGAQPSASDRRKVAELEAMLRNLPPKPADSSAEPAAVLALRHAAEAKAAELGLALGQHAPRRADLAETLLGEPHLIARLAEVRIGAMDNPFMKPLRGTPADVPTLLKQLQVAAAMGNRAQAAELAQIVGLHLAQSGQLGSPLATLHPEMTSPTLRAVLADVVERHAARLKEPTLRAEAAALQQRLDIMPSGRSKGVQAQRAELEARIRTLTAQADAEGRVALREHGISAADARRDAATRQGQRVDKVPDVLNHIANGKLVAQLFADSPNFRKLGEYMAMRRDLHEGRQFTGISAGRTDKGLDVLTLRRVASMEIALLRWITGHYTNPQTGKFNQLGDLLFLKPAGGTSPTFAGAHPALLATDLVEVAIRAAGPLRPGEEPVRHIVDMTPDEAAAHRNDLLARRDALDLELASHPKGSPAYNEAEANWSRAVGDLNLTSKGLGEAAGRKVAVGLDGGPMTPLPIPHAGSGVPDLAYRDASGALVIIECKGPHAGLGNRPAEQGSVPVRAQQGTPEYMTSLGRSMANSSDPQIKALGLAILAEMPNIRYFLAQQTADNAGKLGSIVVKAYDMKEPGR